MFVIHHLERGRSPTDVLARGVLKLRRPPPPEPQKPEPPEPAAPPTPTAPRPAADPLVAQARRSGANLRQALLREHGAEAAALRAEPAEPDRTPPPQLDRRWPVADLTWRTGAAPPPPGDLKPRDGRPQPRSRGP